VVHRRSASPAPVTPKTAAAWRPAAGLCRARRCAGRTSAAASGRSAMKPADCAGERSSGGIPWMLALRACEVGARPQDCEHGSDGMNRRGALPVALRVMIAATSMLMCQRGTGGRAAARGRGKVRAPCQIPDHTIHDRLSAQEPRGRQERRGFARAKSVLSSLPQAAKLELKRYEKTYCPIFHNN